MSSFHDLNKHKCDMDEIILHDSELKCSNIRRKKALSKKMMQTKINETSRDNSVNYSVKKIDKDFSFISNPLDNKLNKSYDLFKNTSDDSFIKDFPNTNNDNNYFDSRRESSINSKNLAKFNDFATCEKKIILNLNNARKDSQTSEYKISDDTNNFENLFDFINNKVEGFQNEMMDYLTKSKLELEELYKKFYTKIIKISTDKARRISQVYSGNSNNKNYLNKNSKGSNNFDNPFTKNNIQNINSYEITPIINNYDNILSNGFSYDSFKDDFFKSNKFPSENSFNLKNNFSGNLHYKNFSNPSFNPLESPIMKKEIENLKTFANKHITERIDSMFELHESLKLSIKQNLDLMKNFLNDYDFNSLNPMQEFINSNADEICTSWVLPKVKFEKLNMNCILKNNKIPKIFRNYLINDSQNKINKYTIEKSESYDLDHKILKQNTLFLEKLIFEKLSHRQDIEKIFSNEQIEKLNFENMKKIKLSNSNFDYFAGLNSFKNLSYINCKKTFFNSIPKNFPENFSNLKKIQLRKCKINNNSLSLLLEELEKLNFLEEINLSCNDITLFHYYGNSKFKNLKTLILRKNKISKFYLKNTKLYPELKLVDLSYNNLVDLNQINDLKKNKVVVLVGKNLGLYKNFEEYKKYLLNLKHILVSCDNKINKLDLSYLYYQFKNNEEFHLKNLSLNKILLFNIKKLDLSFNNLQDEDLSEFFNNNKGLVNLKHLILKNNHFTEMFFKILIDLDLNDLYEYIENINLANNKINYNCLENIYKALDENKNLKKIILTNNPIERDLYSFFCKRMENKEKYNKFSLFFQNLEKLKNEKREFLIEISYNSDLFQFFSIEAKDLSSKFINFQKP